MLARTITIRLIICYPSFCFPFLFCQKIMFTSYFLLLYLECRVGFVAIKWLLHHESNKTIPSSESRKSADQGLHPSTTTPSASGNKRQCSLHGDRFSSLPHQLINQIGSMLWQDNDTIRRQYTLLSKHYIQVFSSSHHSVHFPDNC